MSNYLKKYNIQFLALTLIFLITRYNGLIFVIEQEFIFDQKYINAIQNNFYEYSLFNHTILYGNLLLNKLFFSLSKILNVEYKIFFYIFNICSSFFLLLVYLKISHIFFKKTLVINFFLILSVSYFLISYEIWRLNHHDHLTFFLITFLISLLTIFSNIKNNGFYLFLIILALLISYTMGIVIALVIFSLLIFKKEFKNTDFLKLNFFYFLIIIFVFFGYSYKSYNNTYVFSPTSNAGANLIQRTFHSIGYKNYVELIDNSKKFPSWWVNCNKNIFKNYSYLKNKQIDSLNTKIAHGKCYMDRKGEIDLKKFKNSLEQNNDFVKKILDKDINDKTENNWKFSGEYEEMNLRINAIYGSYGKYVFLEALKRHPKEMIFGKIGNKGFILTSIQMISYGGILPEYYENHKYPQSKLEVKIKKNFRYFFLLLLLITPYLIIKKIYFRSINRENYLNLKFFLYILFMLLIFIIVGLTSVVTCCENPRMTVFLMPMLLYLYFYNLEEILN